MHYPNGGSMQGSHFDTSAYQSSLYGTSPNYDSSTIKLHHGHFSDTSDTCYNGYLSPSSVSVGGNYISRDPPSYAESTIFHSGFAPNTSSSSYYKMPGRSPEGTVGDYDAVRDSMLLKTEVMDPNMQPLPHHRYDTDSTRLMNNDIDVGNAVHSQQSDGIQNNVKLEEEVSEFKTDLSIHEALSSPGDSPECIPQTLPTGELKDEEIPPADAADKPDDADGTGEKDQEDKARGNSDIKPALSYIALIAKSILESSQKRLSLGSIYSWIEKNYPYYLNRGQGWRNSVRHNLSLNDCFIKAGRCEDGKGNYWAIHPANIQDFMRGDFRQRRRSRRRGRKKDCELGMYHMSNGYLGASSPLGPGVPFNPTPALSTIYSPYTDAERRAYRLDDALLRQSMNNPFMKWYHSNMSNGSYGNQQGTCNTGMYSGGSPQWQSGYTEQGSQPVYPLQAFSSRNYTAPALV